MIGIIAAVALALYGAWDSRRNGAERWTAFFVAEAIGVAAFYAAFHR